MCLGTGVILYACSSSSPDSPSSGYQTNSPSSQSQPSSPEEIPSDLQHRTTSSNPNPTTSTSPTPKLVFQFPELSSTHVTSSGQSVNSQSLARRRSCGAFTSESNPQEALLIPSDSLWFTLIFSDSFWFTLILSDSLWFFLIHSDSLLFSLIRFDSLSHSDSLWFSLIYFYSLWFTLILSDSHILSDSVWTRSYDQIRNVRKLKTVFNSKLTLI